MGESFWREWVNRSCSSPLGRQNSSFVGNAQSQENYTHNRHRPQELDLNLDMRTHVGITRIRMESFKIASCLLLLCCSRSFADDSVLIHEPPSELDDEDFARGSNGTELGDAALDQDGQLCEDMVGQGWMLMPIHDSLGGSDCDSDRKCRPIECCSQGNVEQRFLEAHGRLDDDDATPKCRVRDSVLYVVIGFGLFILASFSICCCCCICCRRASQGQESRLQRRRSDDDIPESELPPVPL